MGSFLTGTPSIVDCGTREVENVCDIRQLTRFISEQYRRDT